MAPRKSPIRHKVSGYYRNGKWISTYKRGEGEAPKQRPSTKTVPRTGYSITFYQGTGKTESYNVGSGSITSAIREGVKKIQRPIVPRRAVIRRLTR